MDLNPHALNKNLNAEGRNSNSNSIPADLLEVSEFNVRKSSFDTEDLIESIKSVGVLEPLII